MAEVIYSKESRFDQQGKYFWSLVKEANWTRQQVEALLISKFHATHWNTLNQTERRQVISIMKVYVKKQTEIKEKRLRQAINATWIKAGHNRDELHCMMSDWGFGESLRALGYKDLCSVYGNVRKAVGATQLIRK